MLQKNIPDNSENCLYFNEKESTEQIKNYYLKIANVLNKLSKNKSELSRTKQYIEQNSHTYNLCYKYCSNPTNQTTNSSLYIIVHCNNKKYRLTIKNYSILEKFIFNIAKQNDKKEKYRPFKERKDKKKNDMDQKKLKINILSQSDQEYDMNQKKGMLKETDRLSMYLKEISEILNDENLTKERKDQLTKKLKTTVKKIDQLKTPSDKEFKKDIKKKEDFDKEIKRLKTLSDKEFKEDMEDINEKQEAIYKNVEKINKELDEETYNRHLLLKKEQKNASYVPFSIEQERLIQKLGGVSKNMMPN